VGKGEALKLFSVEKQLISSQNRDLAFPAAVMQEFVHSLFYLIHVFPNLVDDLSRMKKRMNNPTKWISTQMHDLLLANVNSQPLAYRWY
jgi:argininosuccinate lyase